MLNRTYVRLVLTLVCVLGVHAPNYGQDVVPTWPGDQNLAAIPEGKYVFLTPDRHAIVVLVPQDREAGSKGPKSVIRVPLHNDLKPSISVSVVASGGLYQYQYSIANGGDARDAIGSFTLVLPAEDRSLRIQHLPTVSAHPWAGAAAHSVIAPQAIFPWAPRGRYLTWFQQEGNVIPAGKVIDGFTLESSYLPGVTTAWLSSGELVNFDQSWPKEVFEQLELLEDRRFRQVFVPTVAPMFVSTFPKAQIAEEFRKDLQALVSYGWLQPSSRFTEEVLQLAQGLSRNPQARLRAIQTTPQTDVEKAVALVFQFSLGSIPPGTKSQERK